MSFTRRIREHRSTVLLAALLTFSLLLLISGARGGLIADGVRTAASVAIFPFLKVFGKVEDGAGYTFSLAFDYEAMREENRDLRRQFAELLQQVSQGKELLAENSRLRSMMKFDRVQPRLTLMPAEIIQHSPQGILTIDRGSYHGLQESMCVITGEGVIGMITHVDPFTSHVATLQNADCRIDAMILRNRVRGRVHGSGNPLSQTCSVNYIDLKADIRIGDEVVTSPDSVFPSGLPIGRVISPAQAGSLSQVVDITPAADAYKVDEVFVLLNADPRWEDLAGPESAEAELQTDTALLDVDSVQERFAP